jgi:hypothetical protein
MAANARAMAARPTARLPMLLHRTHVLGRMCVRVCAAIGIAENTRGTQRCTVRFLRVSVCVFSHYQCRLSFPID